MLIWEGKIFFPLALICNCSVLFHYFLVTGFQSSGWHFLLGKRVPCVPSRGSGLNPTFEYIRGEHETFDQVTTKNFERCRFCAHKSRGNIITDPLTFA